MEMILLKFDGVFDFIENEEDFLNFIALYKTCEIDGDNLILFNSLLHINNYNYLVFKTNKENIDNYKKKIKKFTKIEYKEFRGEECLDKVTININIDKIESMILEYDKEIKKSISDKNIKNVQLNFGYLNRYSFYDFKNVSVPINEDIFIFIKNKQCLRLYLFFIYYTYKLENNIKWFKLSQRDIGIILDFNEAKVREYINILINNNLIERRRIDYKKNFYYEYRIIPYEEFMRIKSNNFICDSSNKDKNTKSKKEKMIIEKDKSMINIPSMYYIVYEITDLTNGMKYIGKHKTTNINDGYMGSGRLLKQNQEIKGIENFEKKILHLCKNDKHMAEMEAMEIEKVKAYENNMYYNLKKEK